MSAYSLSQSPERRLLPAKDIMRAPFAPWIDADQRPLRHTSLTLSALLMYDAIEGDDVS
jgi:hypothetical protein